MQITDPLYTASMTEQQRAWFYAEYERAHKDEVIGFLLALCLGNFGVHHFYLRRNTAGILYLIFFWTGIPAILGFIECFFMPGRVRQYNAAQALYISSQILAHSNPYTEPTPAASHCPACNSPIAILPLRSAPTAEPRSATASIPETQRRRAPSGALLSRRLKTSL